MERRCRIFGNCIFDYNGRFCKDYGLRLLWIIYGHSCPGLDIDCYGG